MILAGDIGGTKTHLALFTVDGGALRRARSETFRSADFSSLEAVIAAFAGGAPLAARAACFGIAGPVAHNRTRTPNLAWAEVDGAQVARTTGIPDVTLINDLAATAEGLDALSPDELAVVQPGEPDRGSPCAVIAAGTGLGMAIKLPGGGVLASEGGHVDFAPRDAVEYALLETLRLQHGRVSLERVVSGPGIGAIYNHLRGDGAPTTRDVEDQLLTGEPAAVISDAARSGTCPLSRRAMEMFLSAYGAAAGNLALTCLARGGVYIGGGVAPRNLDLLLAGGFLDALLAKGRYRTILEKIPVYVVLNQETALLGSAVHARRRLGI